MLHTTVLFLFRYSGICISVNFNRLKLLKMAAQPSVNQPVNHFKAI